MSRLGPFIIDVQGFVLTPEERDMLAHPWVGGVIYFTRNFESKEQIHALGQEIHSVARPLGSAPLLICIDHEGGRVQRFRQGFTEIPSIHDPLPQSARYPNAWHAALTSSLARRIRG